MHLSSFNGSHMKNKDIEKCTDCNGSGIRLEYANVFNGVCFTCNGKGNIKMETNARKVVLVKQYTRKLSKGGSLEFLFWNNGSIQVLKQIDGESVAVHSATLEEARKIYKQPSLFSN